MKREETERQKGGEGGVNIDRVKVKEKDEKVREKKRQGWCRGKKGEETVRRQKTKSWGEVQKGDIQGQPGGGRERERNGQTGSVTETISEREKERKKKMGREQQIESRQRRQGAVRVYREREIERERNKGHIVEAGC